MITCGRCGKENQDHYKFCLGCGNEIKPAAPAAAPTPAPAPIETAPGPAREPLPIETARTALPPEPRPADDQSAAVVTPPPVLSKPRGGIPWNDSPRMPTPGPSPALSAAVVGGGGLGGQLLGGAPLRASAGGMFQAKSGAPDVTPPPVAKSAPASMLTPPPEPTSAPSPVGTTPGSGLSPAAPTPGPLASPGADSSRCPNCGQPVNPGFAFCGSCGARVTPAGASAAPVAQRTMFMAAPSPVATPRGRLILIRPDGSEGGAHPLHDGANQIGRSQGSLFESDLYLSPRHAELILGPEGLVIRDLRSLNGVFVKIGEEEPLESADVFRIGQELLRFELIASPVPLEDGTEVAGTPNPGFWGRLSVIVGRDVDGSAFPLFGDAIVLGRERGDILFPEDGYVSGTHARISLRDGRVYLADMGSSNGTFLRIRGERALPTGSFALMGQQLFRIEYR